MNLREIRKKFDDMCRSAGLDSMDSLRDSWIDQGWSKIAEQFPVPSLTKTIRADSIANQQFYNLPYDYNGADIGFLFDGVRLDPVPDETLRLKYERSETGYGRPKYYDWSGCVGADLYVWANATLTNESDQVVVDHPVVTIAKNVWIRFDPYQDGANAEADPDGWVNPCDFGYLIVAGTYAQNAPLTLSYAYRGPSGDRFTVRIRPAETQQIVLYGTPTTASTDALSIRYSSRPKRLYNDTDVPEWPNMGDAIANMAISVSLEYHHNMDLAKQFWGRAVSSIAGLKRRREGNRTLVSDLSVGSSVSRRTGLRGTVSPFHGRGMFRCR